MEQIVGISFGAIPLNKVKVKKYDTKKHKFVSIPAHFVLLDSENAGDLDAINYASKKWKKAAYIKKINTAANWMNTKNYIKVFALTEQKKNFEKLSPKKILGFAEMREEQEDGNHLSHIQVKPTAINVNSNAHKYKKTGKGIIKSLKRLYNQFALVSIANKNVERFYRDNGLIESYDAKGYFVWERSIFKRLKLITQNFCNRFGLF